MNLSVRLKLRETQGLLDPALRAAGQEAVPAPPAQVPLPVQPVPLDDDGDDERYGDGDD